MVSVDSAAGLLNCVIGDSRMEPGFSQNHHTTIPDKVVGCYPQLEVIHFVNDGSYICKEDTWQRGLVWVLL